MTVKNINFERDFLKHRNYKNGFHVYKGMETTADSKDTGIPESVVKVLFRIFSETQACKE